jgi:type III secretion system FlhB-like substrate exporter
MHGAFRVEDRPTEAISRNLRKAENISTPGYELNSIYLTYSDNSTIAGALVKNTSTYRSTLIMIRDNELFGEGIGEQAKKMISLRESVEVHLNELRNKSIIEFLRRLRRGTSIEKALAALESIGEEEISTFLRNHKDFSVQSSFDFDLAK